MILEKGADINRQGGYLALHYNLAAASGGNSQLSYCFSNEVPTLHNQFGERVLHAASAGGNFEVVKLLLECGFNVNLQGAANEDWSTPLHCASRAEHTENAKILLEWGARVNVRGVLG